MEKQTWKIVFVLICEYLLCSGIYAMRDSERTTNVDCTTL